MEENALIGLILIIGGIAFACFQVALMFKLWDMCNDVRELKDYLVKDNLVKNGSLNETPNETPKQVLTKFHVNEKVVRVKDNKQMKVKYVTNSEEGDTVYWCEMLGLLGWGNVDQYKESEIKSFNY